MLNKSKQKQKPRRNLVPTKKKWDERDDVHILIEKTEGIEEKNIRNQQERKKEESTQGEYANYRLARNAGGYVRNRRTESATKESREAKRKARKTST